MITVGLGTINRGTVIDQMLALHQILALHLPRKEGSMCFKLPNRLYSITTARFRLWRNYRL